MYGKVSLVLLLLSEISKNKANYCGQEIFYGINGTIETNPTPSDTNTSCLWTIHPPQNRITTIRILKTGFDDCLPNHTCCLSVTSENSNRNYITLCNETPEKPVTLSIRGNRTLIYLQASQNVNTWIDFFTRENSECHQFQFQCYDKSGCYNSTGNCNRDFTCSDHSDKVNCGKCPINLTLCNLKSKKCFDPIAQRCDGVIHCPKGEDELNCSDLCPNLIKCPKDRRCIKQEQVCNSEKDCSDGFDEKTCSNVDSSIYFTLVFAISSLCSISFICIVLQWLSTRRNAQRFLNNPPEFPLAPFEGPGDQERESSGSEMFTDSEFRQGGTIYESYLQTLKKTKPIKAVLSSTNKQTSYMDLDGDNELIVLASLNVPVDMCVGLALSSEKINLTEVLTQERLKSISKIDVEGNQSGSGESSQSSEVRCIEGIVENTLRKTSIRCSEKNSERTFIISDSSEWTDIEDSSESSSRIIYVKSANKHNIISLISECNK